MTTLPDPIKRALRTFAQAFIAALVVWFGSLAANPRLPDADTIKLVLVGAVATGLVSLLHNSAEDAHLVPAVGKTPTPPPPAPGG